MVARVGNDDLNEVERDIVCNASMWIVVIIGPDYVCYYIIEDRARS